MRMALLGTFHLWTCEPSRRYLDLRSIGLGDRMKLFGIALFLASLLVAPGCGVNKGKEAAELNVAEFHAKLDSGDFAGIYRTSHSDFRNDSQEGDFVTFLETVHTKLGPIVGTEQTGWNIGAFNLKTNVTLMYKTTFVAGDALETFSYRIEGDQALLFGYNINSRALFTQ